MARDPVVDLVVPDRLWSALQTHLFRDDHDEHGAIIAAGVAVDEGRVRLLARNLILAEDGIHYLPGERGYRMLTGSFVRDGIVFCREHKLAYLAVHNHFGANAVDFSDADLASHERGYPTLLDLNRGQPVGGLVLARGAVAGDIWFPSGRRLPLRETRVLGPSLSLLYASPPPRPGAVDETYDRQARLFGDRGQELLGRLRVGVIGLGGVGSLVCEFLARLGVGTLVLVDPDHLSPSNVSRVLNSTANDAKKKKLKVRVAGSAAKRANRDVNIIEIAKSVVEADAAAALKSCDYLFLAADSMQARLVFNCLVHQHLIPGVQLGAKVPVNRKTGEVGSPFSVVRPVSAERGCLSCNGLIPPDRLQLEMLTEEQRRQQRYVDEENIVAPSVITLNAVAASRGVDDFLFMVTGLRREPADDYVYFSPRDGTVRLETPREGTGCVTCSPADGAYAMGDAVDLPTRT